MKKFKYISFLSLSLVGGIGHAGTAVDCATPDSIAVVISQFEETFYTIWEKEKKLKTEMREEIKIRVDADKWTEEHIRKVFLDIKNMPQFAKLQEQENTYRTEVKAQDALRNSSPNREALCKNTASLMETMQKLHEINAQELVMMTEKIKEAK
ncbi:MAG: hypothetical protein LBE62_14145 [Azonexus sp.]|jgi:hypothetical protein|nr:hypothetical protein [Azonexus sp.]